MAKVTEYIKESYDELTDKVTWPTWSELQSSAILVLVASIIIALIILLMDTAFGQGLHFFYSSLNK
ncbi:preprotein translocase subunit SecE [Mucilaginibacter sp. AW1-3]